MQVKNIAIMGAGLVGSLLSIYLKKKGYAVEVYERRPDYRKTGMAGGRSINLAMSDRGWKGLAGVGIEQEVRDLAIPMHGRMVHGVDSSLNYQPYGKQGQFINSISRGGLNTILIEKAEKAGVPFHFNHRIIETDLQGKFALIEDSEQNKSFRLEPDLIIAADGAFSLVRLTMMKTDQFNYSQQYEQHSYKELTIPAAEDGTPLLEINALHIWPRKSFMLIALPNLDGSFTCTLFHYTNGDNSFSALTTKKEVLHFFTTHFPTIIPLMPNLVEEFFENPTGSLVTIKCYPWVNGNSVLIGDAAHAIIPFYGQGMNCGFEDCSVLNDLIDAHNHDWSKILPAFQENRKPNADGIADLAQLNFIEMRDLVADPLFQLKKKIVAKVSESYPNSFVPVYTMVSFSQIPYSIALQEYYRQDALLDKIIKMPNIEQLWQTTYFDQIANLLIQK